MAQSTEQLAAARELAAQYGLTKDDFYQHKQSKAWLISRTGIEKIQYKAGISVSFEAIRTELEFAAVQARAARKVKAEGAKTAASLTIETFGSACKANCQVSYYLEMAEKRALSRAVLKLTDFYQLGVYGEDEIPPVSRGEEMSEVSTQATVVETPKKPAAEASAPASTFPAPSGTAAASGETMAERLEAVLREIERELNSRHLTSIERHKILAGLSRFNLEKANTCLAYIGKTCEERTHPDALGKARTALRSFTNANASALGDLEYNRLHARAGALTVTAVDLIAEMQEAEQKLKTPQQAAA